MDSILSQLQREVNKINLKKTQSRQDNINKKYFNSGQFDLRNNTLSQQYRQGIQEEVQSQSASYHSPESYRGQHQGNNRNAERPVSSSRRQDSGNRSLNSSITITPREYNSSKEQIKQVFMSKDELFKKVNTVFEKIISSKSDFLSRTQNTQQIIQQQWIIKEQEFEHLENLVKQSQLEMLKAIEEQQKYVITSDKLPKSQSQERRTWLSKNPSVAKKMTSQLKKIKEEEYRRNLDSFESSSDCNVEDDDEEIQRQSSKVSSIQSSIDRALAEKSLQIAVGNFEKILNFINYFADLVQQTKDINQIPLQYLSEQEQLLKDFTGLQQNIRVLEERYYSTTIAWEKELRDLINQNKLKSQKIIEIEVQYKELALQKNDYQFKYENFEKEMELINNQLYIQFGIDPIDYQTDYTGKFNVDLVRRVFQENDRLRQDYEKLIENIESSRADIQKVSLSQRSASREFPIIVNQQVSQVKDQYELQLQQLQQKYEQKYTEQFSELSKSRNKVIEMIDDKQKMDQELYQLKLEKKDLKNDLEVKTARVLDLEVQLQEYKYKSTHIVMQAESRAVAINEVQSRNELLNDSLENVKNELLNTKRVLSQMENDKFELEKESLRIKRDIKKLEIQNLSLQDEKEHLIQMLELKNHLLDSDSKNSTTYNGISQTDYFQAIQRLSMFVINRSSSNSQSKIDNLDENTKNIVRGIFNENVCKLLDQYEMKIESQQKMITDLYKELSEAYNTNINSLESTFQYLDLLQELNITFQKIPNNKLSHDLLLISEKLQRFGMQYPIDKNRLSKEAEQSNDKLRMVYLKLETFNDGLREQMMNMDKTSYGSNSPQRIKSQLMGEFQLKFENELEELKNQNENLKYKIDMTSTENEEMKHQLTNMKKKDNDIQKLKAQNEQLKELVSKLQKNQNGLDSEKDFSNFSELKQVIQRLDNELKREKSQNTFLKQQLNDQSLFDGLDGFMEDEVYFNKSNDARSYKNNSISRENKRANKHTSSDALSMIDDQSPINSPFTNNSKQMKRKLIKKEHLKKLELEIAQYQKKVEDSRQMIELQCIVIEDLLTQRGKLQQDIQVFISNHSPVPEPKQSMANTQINHLSNQEVNSTRSPRNKDSNLMQRKELMLKKGGESRIPKINANRKPPF
ncbi:UNKNOWN [Stylonychia lemnae]|uniref:Uncharacterized protein n=1 Tax=Stylonychia lemnae TaxID=5949 RepID=A0A078ACR0_STYLE|nr:UNKNOWN [Stylonychia lemnae]|eukprot:CDW80040.1 UNKNOWN [Stylonychia lemnae]